MPITKWMSSYGFGAVAKWLTLYAWINVLFGTAGIMGVSLVLLLIDEVAGTHLLEGSMAHTEGVHLFFVVFGGINAAMYMAEERYLPSERDQ